MEAREVLRVLGALAAAAVPAWVGGGWGVDALVGRQTRLHDDLDLCVDAAGEARAIVSLGKLGYCLADDRRPVRFVMADDRGHLVDLHPVVFEASGTGLQANLAGLPSFVYPAGTAFASGQIGGSPVACLSVAQQVAFHLGYTPKEKDRQDMATLHRRLGTDVPPPYGAERP